MSKYNLFVVKYIDKYNHVGFYNSFYPSIFIIDSYNNPIRGKLDYSFLDLAEWFENCKDYSIDQ